MEQLHVAKITVYNPKTEEMFCEESYVLLNQEKNRILTLGKQAKEKYEEEGTQILFSPFYDCHLEDFNIAQEFLSSMIETAFPKGIRKPHLFAKKKTLILVCEKHVSEQQKNCYCDLAYITTMPGELAYLDGDTKELNAKTALQLCRKMCSNNAFQVAIVVQKAAEIKE